MAVTPFTIRIDDDVLADLRLRLGRTRLARSAGGGLRPDGVRGLVDRWLDLDWRACEHALEAWPQVLVNVDGVRLHAVHRRSADPGARAIVLAHGWPHSFLELLPLAERLHEFHVVIPSLPGFLYSEPYPQDAPFTPNRLAETLHGLMTALGYERYLTYGEDVAAGASDALAARHPEAVEGIFATHAYFPPDSERPHLGETERAFFDWLDEQWRGASGYAVMQTTRPDTLAAALADSPAGLAAWIVEKFREWSDPRSAWHDDIDAHLTTATLYWATNSIGTSFRPYFDGRVEEEPAGAITVPAGVAVQTHEGRYPRELAERGYRDLRTFGYLDRGGHFAAAEAPDEVASALRAFVATLD